MGEASGYRFPVCKWFAAVRAYSVCGGGIAVIQLNDYLYSGNTVLRILYKYTNALRESAKKIDLIHCNFLIQITELLEHNEFLTLQSQRIREFYKFLAGKYPYLAFSFKGRIKSLIRAEEKVNGYIVEHIYNYYSTHGSYPSVPELKNRLNCFRDLIAYRIVISMPRCHLKREEDREDVELKYLYEISNHLADFLEERGFSAKLSGTENKTCAVCRNTAGFLNIIMRKAVL